MDFYDYATTHDLTRRAGLTNDPPAAFYRQLQAAAYAERARGVKGMAVEFNRYQSELNWSLAGRPYYKLWPAIIPLLAGVGIVEIPGSRSFADVRLAAAFPSNFGRRYSFLSLFSSAVPNSSWQ